MGDYGKRELVERLLSQHGFSIGEVVYAGDSRNDGPLFKLFPASVGVANVAPLLDELRALGQAPALLTEQPAGDGFVELVTRLLADRLAGA